MHDMGYKGDAYDTTVNYLAGEPVNKCENKECNINSGWNEQCERPLCCGVRLEKLSKSSFVGLGVSQCEI